MEATATGATTYKPPAQGQQALDLLSLAVNCIGHIAIPLSAVYDPARPPLTEVELHCHNGGVHGWNVQVWPGPLTPFHIYPCCCVTQKRLLGVDR